MDDPVVRSTREREKVYCFPPGSARPPNAGGNGGAGGAGALTARRRAAVVARGTTDRRATETQRPVGSDDNAVRGLIEMGSYFL